MGGLYTVEEYEDDKLAQDDSDAPTEASRQASGSSDAPPQL